MKRTEITIRNIAGYAWTALLFLLTAVYAFVSLGVFSFGIVSLPCVLLGRMGIFIVVSDFAPEALLLVTAGALTAGLGMCLGIIPVCVSVYGAYSRIRKAAVLRKERMFNEEDTTS